MGFSIGKLLGAVAGPIGGLLGGVFGAPVVGATLGRAVGAGFAPTPPRPPSTVPTMQTAALRPGQIIGPFSAVASLFGGAASIASILQNAREFRPGATRNKIIAAAKACGIDVAADTFGLGTDDVCAIVVAGATRRRRGVSAANIRTTKRVIRFSSGLSKDLRKLSK